MRKKRETLEREVHETLLDMGRLEAEFNELKEIVIEMEECAAEAKRTLELALVAESEDYPELKIKYDHMVETLEGAHQKAALLSARMMVLKQKEVTLLADFYGEGKIGD